MNKEEYEKRIEELMATRAVHKYEYDMLDNKSCLTEDGFLFGIVYKNEQTSVLLTAEKITVMERVIGTVLLGHTYENYDNKEFIESSFFVKLDNVVNIILINKKERVEVAV